MHVLSIGKTQRNNLEKQRHIRIHLACFFYASSFNTSYKQREKIMTEEGISNYNLTYI